MTKSACPQGGHGLVGQTDMQTIMAQCRVTSAIIMGRDPVLGESPRTQPTAHRHSYKDTARMLCVYVSFSDDR